MAQHMKITTIKTGPFSVPDLTVTEIAHFCIHLVDLTLTHYRKNYFSQYDLSWSILLEHTKSMGNHLKLLSDVIQLHSARVEGGHHVNVQTGLITMKVVNNFNNIVTKCFKFSDESVNIQNPIQIWKLLTYTIKGCLSHLRHQLHSWTNMIHMERHISKISSTLNVTRDLIYRKFPEYHNELGKTITFTIEITVLFSEHPKWSLTQVPWVYQSAVPYKDNAK